MGYYCWRWEPILTGSQWILLLTHPFTMLQSSSSVAKYCNNQMTINSGLFGRNCFNFEGMVENLENLFTGRACMYPLHVQYFVLLF